MYSETDVDDEWMMVSNWGCIDEEIVEKMLRKNN